MIFDALGKLALGQVPLNAPFNFPKTLVPSVRVRAVAAVAMGSSIVLLATNPVPFKNIHAPLVRTVRPAAPDQFHINIGNFPNPSPIIPIDWNKPKQPPTAKEQPNWGLNLNLFPNPIPFAQYDWSRPHQSPNYPVAVSSQFNLNLRVPARPVIPNDLSFSSFAKPRAPDQTYPNLSLSFGAPFTPIDWSRPHAVVISQIPVLIGFQINHFPVVTDSHDGVWVKKKKRRSGPDPIEIELAEKASRRAALELAIYGPEVEYTNPVPVFESPEAPVNVAELAKVVAQVQAAHHQVMRAQSEEDEETDLESILREIL